MIMKIRRERISGIILLLVFPFVSVNASGDFSGNNRTEYQLGNIPAKSEENRTNLYNQLNLNYRSDELTLGVRAEIFNVDHSENSYTRFSQKYLRYKKGGFQLQVGNFYEIIGKGMLLRAFDIPGVTYEDLGSRQRYGFYQDIEGLSMRYTSDMVEVKVLSGYPLDRSQPPLRKRDSRRPKLVHAGEINLNLNQNITPGILYLREEVNSDYTEYGGLNFQGYTGSGIQYYAEYVQDLHQTDKWFSLNQGSTHALYTSLNYIYDWLSLSAEFKDYHNFTLGYNEPPSLVKEHTFSLLNRSTHSIIPLDERGYQFEAMINLYDLNTATINYSNAKNEIFNSGYSYFEIYADLNFYPSETTNLKGFIDLSEDEISSHYDRWTTGVSYEMLFKSVWNAQVEVQNQQYDVRYRFNPQSNYKAANRLLGLTLSRSPGISGGIIIEQSDDRNEIAGNNSFGFFDNKFWPGIVFNYNYNQDWDFSVFYGKRRGGNSCIGGICYEVQPFQGLELRMSTLF